MSCRHEGSGSGSHRGVGCASEVSRDRAARECSRCRVCCGVEEKTGASADEADWPEVVELWRQGVCVWHRERDDGEKTKGFLMRVAEEGATTMLHIADETSVLDLVIIGCGPTRLFLAAESVKKELIFCLVGPDLPFTNNYEDGRTNSKASKFTLCLTSRGQKFSAMSVCLDGTTESLIEVWLLQDKRLPDDHRDNRSKMSPDISCLSPAGGRRSRRRRRGG